MNNHGRSQTCRSFQNLRPANLHTHCPLQGDINEVNKTAHTIKARLEKLDADNAKALRQTVRGE